MRQGYGFSHAKIILIGEHAVVYGQPAIALPLPSVKLTVTMQQTTQQAQLLHSRYYDGPLDRAMAQLTGIQKLIQALLRHFQQPNESFELTIESDLPAERGMGSSAATAIGIIRCFYDYFKTKLPTQTLLNWADFSEKIIHGKPSGLDAATASAKTPIWFVKGQMPYELQFKTKGYLVIADSGIKGRTSTAVALVRQELTDAPIIFKPKIAKLGQLTTAVKANLAQGDLKALGQNLTLAQQQLKDLGVSSKALDRLIQVALTHGALGAKLTGGGQGGCLLALAPDLATAENLQQALSAAGAIDTWRQPLAEINHT
ncbi:mevalonate kinase [Agrilactobacillus yilanensis]|uniref:Mevalonate kinase n=1 Tax=Agrilactobacillus yilanensis TaxID=2485997 RepID=A0ABW4J877_9LACO|nr:mevalonate kinase [Agrilactobacillus yilanensis]